LFWTNEAGKWLYCYRIVLCCYHEKTNFVNMISLSTYPLGTQIKLVFC